MTKSKKYPDTKENTKKLNRKDDEQQTSVIKRSMSCSRDAELKASSDPKLSPNHIILPVKCSECVDMLSKSNCLLSKDDQLDVSKSCSQMVREKSLNNLLVEQSSNKLSGKALTSSSSEFVSHSSCQLLFDSMPAHSKNVDSGLPPKYETIKTQSQNEQQTKSSLNTNTKTSNGGSTKLAVKYGELVVLGYNGCIDKQQILGSSKHGSSSNSAGRAQVNSSRRKSKFVLKKREKASGVKPSTQTTCKSSQELSKLLAKNSQTHSIAYTLSRNQTVVVHYSSDEHTDMFQIGRSSEPAIDFIVLDTPGLNASTSQQSTISRYACRILVERDPPHTARIYAAGFDPSKRIFLGEKATKWKNDADQLDGVTTNGVLIMHPTHGFGGSGYDNSTSELSSGEWMEVSVCGAVFSLSESRFTPCSDESSGSALGSEHASSNVLRDGTLIDLCGATLMWRSRESLQRTPTKHYLDMNLEHLNRLKPQCPVGLKTLVFPSSASPIAQQLRSAIIQQQNSNTVPSSIDAILNGNYSKEFKRHLNLASSYYQQLGDRIPMVYLKCGHVHGQHDWGHKKDNERECPLCRKCGPYVQLLIGLEPSFYCDSNIRISSKSSQCTLFKPYAFRPCGHMASEQTCKYWSKQLVPQGTIQGLLSVCPFCSVPLCKEQPFVKLIFQESH